MNKSELVETIARRTEVQKKDVEAVINTFFEVVSQVVSFAVSRYV